MASLPTRVGFQVDGVNSAWGGRWSMTLHLVYIFGLWAYRRPRTLPVQLIGMPYAEYIDSLIFEADVSFRS